MSVLRCLAALLAIAAQGSLLGPVRAQSSIGNSVPVVSIRATVPETREPFCDPAICDAALPAPGVFVVTRLGGDLTRELFVSMGYAGTATSGTDYPALPSFVTFRAGEGSVELLVEAAYDKLSEGDETVVAQVLPDPTLGPIERYRVDPPQSAARVVIRDNEAPNDPVVSIEATSPIAEESSDPYRRLALRGRFTITRTGSMSNALPVFVHYSGTTTPGVDYPFLPWLVAIPAGSNRIDIEVVPTPDDQAEPLETVEATLSGCPPLTDPPMGIPCHLVNIDPARASARVFIRDDGITTASLEMTAPEDGAEFGESSPVSIAATAIDLDGAITHVDFLDGERKIGESSIFFFREPEPGTPVFHEFEWRDAAAGPHLLTARALNAAGNAVTSAPVRILVGGGLPVVSIEASVPETTEPSPAMRIRPGVFTLRRTGDASRALRVWTDYAGTATSGADYLAPPAVVEFPAMAASVEVLIAPLDDGLVEGDETVIAGLTPVAPNYRIDPVNNRARVVIHDNDEPVVPVVSILATRPETREPFCPPNTCRAPTPAPGVFLISRRGGDVTRALTVLLQYGGSALPWRDYTPPLVGWAEILPGQESVELYVTALFWVEIPAGQASVEFHVTALFDELAEGDESVVAALQPDPALGPIERYRVDPAQDVARVVIHDRTPPMLPMVTILATDSFAREGANSSAGPNTATFVVSRVGATADPLDVPFSVGGTASNGVDFAAITSPVTIPAGQLSARIVIRPLDDNRPEPVETVVVTLLENDAAVPGYILGRPHRATAILVDDDGRRDVLWHHSTRGEVWVWPMDGAARTAETYVRTVADTNWEIRGLGDRTSDGKADILWRHKITGEIYLWPMDGSAPLAETYVATVDPSYDVVGTGDFDGDGKSDILWRHVTTGEVWIWLMDGATALSRVYVGTVDPAYVIKGVGDLDGDGKADIVWHHATAGEVWVWLMDGTTRLSATWVATVSDVGYQIAGVADYDGDGKTDILWHHATRGAVWMWRMDGTTRSAETWVATVPETEYRPVGTGDYNGDGKADILWHHATRGEVWVWLMDGTTCLSETWVATVPELGYQIVRVK